MSEQRLTGRQLRAKVAESGYQVSGRRMKDLTQWGLLPPPDEDGRWSNDVVKRLVRVGEMGKTVRSYPRRSILLRCEGQDVPPEVIVEAMCVIVPTITRPVQKMKQASQARAMLSGPDAEPLTVRERNRRKCEAWAPPPPEKWVPVLEKAIPAGVDARFWVWCIAAQWAREYARDTIHDITEVPLEELVTLFAIEDIAAQLEIVRRERAID